MEVASVHERTTTNADTQREDNPAPDMTKSLIDFDLTQLNQTDLNKTPRPENQDLTPSSP